MEPSTRLQDEGITNSFNLFPEKPYCLISRILFGRTILVRLQFDKRLTCIMLIPVKNLNSWKAFEDLFLNCGIIVPMGLKRCSNVVLIPSGLCLQKIEK